MEYKVGDVVEVIYLGVIGTGEIIRVDEGFFSNKYIIKTEVTYNIRGVSHSKIKALTVKEKDIIRVK